jgi:hypothetical protein
MCNHKDSIHVPTMSQFQSHTLLGGLPKELMDLTLAHLDDRAKGNVALANKDMRQIVANYKGSERRNQEYRLKPLTEILRELADPARSPCITRQVPGLGVVYDDARGCAFLRDAAYRKILAPHEFLFAKVKSEPGSRVVITFSPLGPRLFYTLVITHTDLNSAPKVRMSMTYRKRRYPASANSATVTYRLNNNRRGNSVADRAADLDTVEREWADAGVKADLFDWRRNGSRDLPPSVNLAIGIMAFCLVETVVYRHNGLGYRVGFPVIGGNPGPQIRGQDSLAHIIESCTATLTENGTVTLNSVPMLTRWNF